MAMVPNVLVANRSRIVSMLVPSSGFSQPMPALLTSTSMSPAASTVRPMLSGSVTSSARIRRASEAGSRSARGFRIVATTRQPFARKSLAISNPKPDEQPVMRTVFMCHSCSVSV